MKALALYNALNTLWFVPIFHYQKAKSLHISLILLNLLL